MEIEKKIIGDNIKKLRIMNNLTQDMMANIIGYSDGRQIRRLETEGTMNLDIIVCIAIKFKVSPLSLLSANIG